MCLKGIILGVFKKQAATDSDAAFIHRQVDVGRCAVCGAGMGGRGCRVCRWKRRLALLWSSLGPAGSQPLTAPAPR